MAWITNPILGGLSSLVTILKFIGTVLKTLLQKIPNKKVIVKNSTSEGEALKLIERFVLLLESHSISRTQIPDFLADVIELSFKDINTDQGLLEKLSPAIIKDVCRRFGVQPEWIEGADDQSYPDMSFDKDPIGFIDFLSDLKANYQDIHCFFIKDKNDELIKNVINIHRFPIAMVLRVSIKKESDFSEQQIYKYYPLADHYFWGYERTRLQLKAFTFIAFQLGIHIWGCNVPKEQIEQIIERKIFAGPIIQKAHQVAWRPDDYIFTNRESAAALDPDEALAARDYMPETGWVSYLESINGPLKLQFIVGGTESR